MSADGATVFVTGGGTGLTSGFDYTTLAYDASTGATRGSKTYNGPGNSYDEATPIGLSPDGSRVFVTGASRGTGTKLDYATVAYDAASGARLWVKRYNGLGNGIDYGTVLGVSVDGAIVFVTGYSPGSGAVRTTPPWPTTPRPGRRSGPCATAVRATAAMRHGPWRSAPTGRRCS